MCPNSGKILKPRESINPFKQEGRSLIVISSRGELDFKLETIQLLHASLFANFRDP